MTLWQKIKLLMTLNDAGKKLKEASKMGIKTTEFWLTALTILGSVAAAVVGFIPADAVLKFASIVVPVYVIARVVVKLTPTTKDDQILAKVEELLVKLGIKIPAEK